MVAYCEFHTLDLNRTSGPHVSSLSRRRIANQTSVSAGLTSWNCFRPSGLAVMESAVGDSSKFESDDRKSGCGIRSGGASTVLSLRGLEVTEVGQTALAKKGPQLTSVSRPNREIVGAIELVGSANGLRKKGHNKPAHIGLRCLQFDDATLQKF